MISQRTDNTPVSRSFCDGPVSDDCSCCCTSARGVRSRQPLEAIRGTAAVSSPAIEQGKALNPGVGPA